MIKWIFDEFFNGNERNCDGEDFMTSDNPNFIFCYIVSHVGANQYSKLGTWRCGGLLEKKNVITLVKHYGLKHFSELTGKIFEAPAGYNAVEALEYAIINIHHE